MLLVPSGVDAFEHVTEPDLRAAMPELARINALLIVHAEPPRDEAALAGSRTDNITRDVNMATRDATRRFCARARRRRKMKPSL